MGLFSAINIAATGMSAERLRTDVISDNIANSSTTRTAEGGPFKRSRVVLRPRAEGPYYRLPFQLPGINRFGQKRKNALSCCLDRFGNGAVRGDNDDGNRFI